MIKDAFDSTMNRAAFHRKGDGWYGETDEAVLVANLQKSNFGDQYYVNLAVWLKSFGDCQYPKEYRCHIRIRATTIDADAQTHWEREVFNLEHRVIPDDSRTEMIRTFVETIALPFLRAAGSLEGLRRLQHDGRLKGAAVLAPVQQVIQG